MPHFLRRAVSRHPLARDLAPVLILKLAAIFLAAQFLFGPAQRVHVDAEAAARHILDQGR